MRSLFYEYLPHKIFQVRARTIITKRRLEKKDALTVQALHKVLRIQISQDGYTEVDLCIELLV